MTDPRAAAHRAQAGARALTHLTSTGSGGAAVGLVERSLSGASEVSVLVRTLRDRIRTTLAQVTHGPCRCALVDFPDHANVGDSAIWAGERAWLAEAGFHVAYRCDVRTYSKEQLTRTVVHGPIFIHGGGNLGDLWLRHQRLRETVIRDFHDRPIIQFPQTIYFDSRESVPRVRAAFDSHPNLTLLLRDPASLDFARNEFRANSLLCPDMAFYLGLLRRPRVPDTDILWLRREDREAVPRADVRPDAAFVVCDWIDDRVPTVRRARRAAQALVNRYPRRLRAGEQLIGAAYDWQARQRVKTGCRLLARGRAVITDRLHAHILCLALGIPHVMLDNNYGKLRGFFDAWTAPASLATWADTAPDAVAAARAMLQRSSV